MSLPTKQTGDEVFAIRADGDSMEGGPNPIHDGDWLVMRYARGVGLGAIQGSVALVQHTDEQGGLRYQVKRVVKEGDRWMLRSDNPERPSFEAREDCVPIAKLVETIRPETLAPEEGTEIAKAQLGDAFGLEEEPRTGRVEGHLFYLAKDGSPFPGPDRLRWDTDRQPGETLFVLLKVGRTWRYRGVARWSEEERLWRIPEFDFDAWRSISGGRGASRTLTPDQLQRATELARELFTRWPTGTIVEADGKRLRVMGPAAKGGIRIDGGPGGFGERTVSITDLAWALISVDEAARTGNAPEEHTVNRLRYVNGTPQGSTRWIDTKHALALVRAARKKPS